MRYPVALAIDHDPRIESAEFDVAEPVTPGTAKLFLRVVRGSLPAQHRDVFLLASYGRLQMAIVIVANGLITVTLGEVDVQAPLRTDAFRLPARVDESTPHTIEINCVNWRIVGIMLDGASLASAGPPAIH